MRRATWAAAVILSLSLSAAGGEMKRVWTIGKADDDTAEFALGRDGFRNYSRDGLFIVGKSDPGKDWPYTHPGPSDTWAGGRAHTFTILFGLEGDVSAGRLVVDLADTHGIRPPSLRITVNGTSYEHTTPKGGTDASITGNPAAGKEHILTIDLPAGVLKAGLNEIAITNYRLSWLLYDWLGLEAAGDVQAAPAEGALLRSAQMDRWLSRRRGKLTHACQATYVCIGGLEDLALKADGQTKSLPPTPGPATAE
ncbi:MAG: polysaccharide lyase family protein, partial [bacterium]